jgi:DNA repair photolyase
MTKMYKRYKWDETVRLDEKCLKDNLVEGNFIFVGSSGDMFAENIKRDWIKDVLAHCYDYNNTYLFQSKNPSRFGYFMVRGLFPESTILATTIESDMDYKNHKAPSPEQRAEIMESIIDYKIIITVEPVMDFQLKKFLDMLIRIQPYQINIGADSGHNNLSEPPKEKLIEFIDELKKTDIKVHLKSNLDRLLK